MSRQPSRYKHAKHAFRTLRGKHRLFVFYDMPAFPISREEIDICMERCREGGIGCVIPRLPANLKPSPALLPQIARMYDEFAAAAAKYELRVGINIESTLEQSYFMTLEPEKACAISTHVLVRREYYCDPKEVLNLPVQNGELMAISCYDDEHADIIDLREYVTDGRLHYTVPDGNWTVEQYVCTTQAAREDENDFTRFCNLLNPNSYASFLDGLFETLELCKNPEMGKSFTLVYVPDLCFHAPNRRNWDPTFNDVFKARFGFDPAPYYPALYHHIGEKTPHIKSLFMDCRAHMLRSGVLCALKAFCDRHNLRMFATFAEPKLPACSWLHGDMLANEVFSPCAVQEKAYLYGLNSTHLAASAADNYGSKYVSCEMFRKYAKLDKTIAQKDALNAYGHGANLLIAHLDGKLIHDPERLFYGNPSRHLLPQTKHTFPAYAARVQSLLRGGSRINDIAMLYPIYALHDKVFLYEAPTNGKFEYPDTPFSCDYMTVLDTLSTYAGQDVTVIHPEVINRACHTENGVLYLQNPFQTQKFRILIMPGADMVSLENMRLIKRFYEAGGKIIATGTLPQYAFEYTAEDDSNINDPDDFMNLISYGTKADREVRAIVREIFGNEAINRETIRNHYYHCNENGGEAYFLDSAQTAADGTELVDCTRIFDALLSFGVPLDVIMPAMPRFECIGALSNSYNEFVRLGLVDRIPGGGMISHIHKQRDDLNIYYFANTTDRAYNQSIYLRGIHTLERWDPHTGQTGRLHVRYVRFKDEAYSSVFLHLPPDHSVFIVAKPTSAQKSILASLDGLPDMSTEVL